MEKGTRFELSKVFAVATYIAVRLAEKLLSIFGAQHKKCSPAGLTGGAFSYPFQIIFAIFHIYGVLKADLAEMGTVCYHMSNAHKA